MKKTTGVLAFAAAAVVLAQPMLAQAHDWRRASDECTDRIHRNGTTGAVLGGIAGAVLGSNVASHRNRTEGTVIGALAGAAVGSNIARSSTKDRCRYRGDYGYAGYDGGYYGGGYAPYYDAYPAYAPHDRGLHRGWYKHHHHDDDWDD